MPGDLCRSSSTISDHQVVVGIRNSPTKWVTTGEERTGVAGLESQREGGRQGGWREMNNKNQKGKKEKIIWRDEANNYHYFPSLSLRLYVK